MTRAEMRSRAATMKVLAAIRSTARPKAVTFDFLLGGADVLERPALAGRDRPAGAVPARQVRPAALYA